ncbi:MAG: glycosyltransferase family 2 protein [Moheibacter sp.]
MTSILIKSFNRPFYLDRCLESIFLNVEGNFSVSILDDGTPKKYLDRIKEKYPNVSVRLSEHYNGKQKLIDEQKEIDGFTIPVKLWKSEVEKSTDYVLVTEDDVWFTQKVNLDELTAEMKKNKSSLIHLGWLGKKDMESGEQSDHPMIQYYDLSDVFSSNQFVMDALIYNKFKLFSILYKLGLVSNETKPKYWKLNSILMGLWQKEYWLYVWKDSDGKVDEKEQLRNAAVWLNRHKKNKKLILKTTDERMKTTFQSSATNSYHKYGNEFDANRFNRLINEAWYNDEFDPMQNYPADFESGYFEKFLEDNAQIENFRDWIKKFKEVYSNIGANVN